MPSALPAPVRIGRAVLAVWLAMLALLAPAAAHADPTFPQLTGPVVDGAGVIPADEKARIEQKLVALKQQSQRELTVVTLPDLQGYDIADYGYQLGRHWGLGDKQRNDGAILIVAPKERKVRIEVGYGLEGTLTDGLSSLIIQQQIVPRFKAGDLPGGIGAGTDAIIQQLTLPPDQAAKIAAEANARQTATTNNGDPGGAAIFFVIGFIVLFWVLRSRLGGRRYMGGSGLGPLIVFDALSHLSDGRRGGGWGGGGDWGGGGGGFGGGWGGGGGSFGGGGASGSW